MQRAFQVLLLITVNCSKNTALITLQMCPGHGPVSTPSSTSSSFPPANPHLTLEGGWLQYLDLSGPPGNVITYLAFFRGLHFTFPVQNDSGILLHAFTPGGPGSTLLLFPFSLTLIIQFHASWPLLSCRDKRSLTAAGAVGLVLDGDQIHTVLPAVLFDR